MDRNEEERDMAIAHKESEEKLTIMSDIRKIAQQNMMQKGLTFNDVKASLGIKRYEEK